MIRRLAYAALALALLTRLARFGSSPPGFNQDEALLAYDAYSISISGEDHYGMLMPVHLTAWGYGQMSALPAFLMAPFIALMGLNPLAARLPFLLASMAGLWAFWIFARESAGEKAGLAALVLCAFSPWHFMQSRWALDCLMFPHFLAAAMALLACGLKRGKTSLLILSMPLFALSMYCYAIAFVSVPLLLAVLAAALLLSKKATLKDTGKCLGAFLLFAWPLVALMAVNTLGLDTIRLPFLTIPRFWETVRGSSFLFMSQDPLADIKQNAAALFQTVILQTGQAPWNAVEGFGLVFQPVLPFALVGLTAAAKRRMIPLLCWTGVSLATGIIVNGVNANRINIIYYPLILLCAMGLAESAEAISSRLPGKAGMIPPAACAAAVLASFALFCGACFNENDKILSLHFMEGFNEAFDFAEAQDPDMVLVTWRTQSEESWWVSDAMTLYASAMDPLYLQGRRDVERNGRKLLPKQERYRSVQFQYPVIPRQGVGYIFNEAERELFPDSLFDVEMFCHFGSAKAKTGAVSG